MPIPKTKPRPEFSVSLIVLGMFLFAVVGMAFMFDNFELSMQGAGPHGAGKAILEEHDRNRAILLIFALIPVTLTTIGLWRLLSPTQSEPRTDSAETN